MKYSSGGITAKLGETVTVEVPGSGKSKEVKPKTDPDKSRFRLSAWTRTFELLYANPAKGGLPDFDRCRKFLDACAGKLDDLVLLNTVNIQVPKPPDGTPTGKVLWDSDFYLDDNDSPNIARKLVGECHTRGIALHAGYCVVDSGNTPGRRAIAFRKFMETASPDQIKDHATQAVAMIKGAGFDGLSFDLEVNHLTVAAHGKGIEALFTELAAQMAGDNLILSFAGYPFQKDGNSPYMPNMNALPFRLCKIGKNVLARPQAYRMHDESFDAWHARLKGTIKCALEEVGLDPSQLQLGVDYTGDTTFGAVRGDDMSDVCKLARDKKVGVCLWRLEGPGSPTVADYTSWNKALNEGAAAQPALASAARGSASPPPKQDDNKQDDTPQSQDPVPAADSDNPVCSPPPRCIPQFDPRWSAEMVHDQENWKNNACSECSIALVLRWHAEDNPATKGSFKFPALDSSRFSKDRYAHRMLEKFFPDLGGQVPSTSPTQGDLVALYKKTAEALGIDPASYGDRIVSGKMRGPADQKLALIKQNLAFGPVVMQIKQPGHFSVITGYTNDRFFVVDVGACIKADSGIDGIEIGANVPPHSQWPDGPPSGGVEAGPQVYLSIPARPLLDHILQISCWHPASVGGKAAGA